MTDAFGNEPPRHGSKTRTLERLWVEFVKLQRLRAEIETEFDSTGLDETERAVTDKLFASIADELDRVASRVAGIASADSDDIEYKAVMLAEFLPANDRTIQVRLARSLVSDIKNGPYLN